MKRIRPWPLAALAAPAFVAIWGGWVGLGEMTGFGEINLLPGIVDDGGWATINSAITLPIGVEAYAAYALRAWLGGGAIPAQARRFAKGSAIGALVLGAAGQIAYHLLAAAGVTAAPWWITTLVACFPVAVLGMGAALAHLLNGDVDEPAQVVAAEPAHTTQNEPLPEPVEPAQVVQDEPASEPPVEPAQEPRREPAQRRVKTSVGSAPEPAQEPTAERVRAAHEREPAAAHARIAELAQVSVASVKRYRPSRVNGHVPDLEVTR